MFAEVYELYPKCKWIVNFEKHTYYIIDTHFYGEYNRGKKYEMEFEMREDKFSTACADLFIVIMFSVFPLFVKNQYFDITEAKYTLLMVATAALVLSLAVYYILKHKLTCSFLKTAKLSLTDKAILLFALLQFISARWSGIGKEALIGKTSRYMGAYTILVLVILYFIISRTVVISKKLFAVLSVTTILVCGMAILQNLGFDVFHFYKDILEGTEEQFLSTIGNNNFYASYLGVTYGLFMVLYCQEENKILRGLFAVNIVVGTMGVIVAGNNGVFIGVIVSLVFIGYLLIRRKIDVKRVLESLVLILTGALLMYLLRGVFPKSRSIDSLALHLQHTGIIGIMILVLILVRIATNNREFIVSEKQETRQSGHLNLIMITATVLLMLAVIILYVSHVVTIPDSFGTGRGFIWNRLMTTYEKSSLRDQLLGHGPETIGTIFATQYAKETKAFIQLNVNAAHNEFLQYLITVGFAGICSYIVFLLSLCWRGMHSARQNRFGYALVIMIVGYAAHSVVGIAQPNTTPFLFIAAAMLESLNRMFSTQVVNSYIYNQKGEKKHEKV
ncbi:oligosaccharide repeat unit polymerase Wzy [Lachnospiraceae bacterium KM106-2]|nr:oligosaccharide repeat unit polymerase Wzy [Lachnospiraceae bacterium KM106-2]